MKTVTKKRLKAYLIDLAISTTVVGVTEYILRKKVKSEMVHAIVTPSVLTYALEGIQLYRSGQTVGYKKMGLVLESTDGGALTNTQIVKRVLYRETLNGVKYVLNRSAFEKDGGRRLPHDVFAGTVVKEL